MRPAVRRRRSVYSRYFVSYCCIALIPVIVVIATLMVLLRQNYSNSAKELYRRSVIQTATHFDALISDMQSMVDGFAASQALKDLTGDEANTSAIVDRLTQAESGNRLGARVLLYLVGDTHVYTAQGRVPYRALEAEYADEIDFNNSRFFTRLNNTGYFDLAPLYAPETGDFSGTVAALFPCYMQGLNRKGVIVFLIQDEAIEQIAADYIGVMPDYFYLYTANLELAVARESAPQEEGQRLALLRGLSGDVVSWRLSDGRFDVLRHKSDQYGCEFVVGLPLGQLYMDMNRMQTGTLIVLLLVMAGIVFGAIALARYSYRPIKALLDTIERQGESEAHFPNGDWEPAFIGNQLSRMYSEARLLHETLARQQPVVRGHLLQQVLRGAPDESMRRQLQQLLEQKQMEGPCYVALVSGGNESFSLLQRPMLEQILFDSVEGYGVMLEEDRLFAFLIFCDSAEDHRRMQCMDLHDILLINGAADIRMGAGLIVMGVEHAFESFLEAYIALNEGAADGGRERIRLYSQDGGSVGSGTRWELHRDAEIYLQSLRSADFQTACALLESLLAHMNVMHSSLLNASYLRYDLFSKALSACDKEVADALRPEAGSLDLFSDARRFAERMRELTRRNCASVAQRRGSAVDQRRRRILAIIQEHCFESDFSISRLSELSGYSPTFINRFLKDETGLSYNQYVSGLRLERAKRDLAQTDEKIKDIVQRCGYVDIASFNRKFKEYEGVTPGEYRAQHRNGA